MARLPGRVVCVGIMAGLATESCRTAVAAWGEMNKREIDPLGHRQLCALAESLVWAECPVTAARSEGGIARRARMSCIGHGWHKIFRVHFLFGLNFEMPGAGAAAGDEEGCGVLHFWIRAVATPLDELEKKAKKDKKDKKDKKHKKERAPSRPVPEAAQADMNLFATVDSAGTGAEMRNSSASDFEGEMPELLWPFGAASAAEAAAAAGNAPCGQPLVAFSGRVQSPRSDRPTFSQHKCVVACAALDAVRRVLLPDVEQRVDIP